MKKYTHLYKSKKFYILLLLLLISLSAFLYAEGPHIRRLTGVNWFGFETGDYAAHGLWTRDYRSMLRQIKDLGFNCVRIPWSNEMLNHYPANIISNVWVSDPYTGQMGINMNLAGRSSLEVLDKIIEEAERQGLRIILDCHSRAAGGYLEETLWYTDKWPESRWISAG